ncbi:prostaglandin reductase 1-like [Diadema setosum]|uniref:prostaglandin reductase 1-like n=1 Tax=Diadema setosum TaxID=31175 RepID=UPI003B3B5201
MPRTGRRWVLVKYFEGHPKDGDVRLEEFEIPPLKDGEVLLEAEFLTVDPYMRSLNKTLELGSVIMGEQVAKVVESRNKDYPVGTWTLPFCGWTTHSINDCKNLTKMPQMPDGAPRSYAVGTVGMPGLSAYFGFIDVCKPKPGETVFVSGAAGAVGNVVGQIAKIKGCKVIGSAGSDEKLEYLKEIGYDKVFNYKKVTDLDAKIKELAPEGIDIYFDNVGGMFSWTVIMNMNKFGRISVCGNISIYNQKDPEKLPPFFSKMVYDQLKMEGFVVYENRPRYPEGLGYLSTWIREGKLKVREHVTEGFENMFKAFQGLFVGANIGKAVVKV